MDVVSRVRLLMGVRLSLLALMYELAPLLREMLDERLQSEYPQLHLGQADSGSVDSTFLVWYGTCPVLAVSVHDDYVMVSRQIPRYETSCTKVHAADPSFIDKIFDVIKLR